MEGPLPIVEPAEAIAFFRRKGIAFGFAWQDVWQQEHARAFTVAKAMSIDLLEDIRAAVDKALAGGETLEQFRAGLEPTLQAKGWWGRKPMTDPLTGARKIVQLGSPRRLRTIFDINMRTAYAAGRWERQQRTKAAFPFLRYVHADGIRNPRPQHVAWNGTIKLIDDPWWDTHYGPCGWGCHCYTQAVNQRMMDRRGWTVTEHPVEFPVQSYTNPRTGEVTKLEGGISPGFAYNVGRAYLDSLAPRPLPESFGDGDGAASASAAAPPIGAFLKPFGLEDGRSRIFLDRDGWPLAIGVGWFRRPDGAIDVPAELGDRQLAAIGAAIADPVVIRWRWVRDATGRANLMRRYTAYDVQVDVGRIGWRYRFIGAELQAEAAFNPRQPRDRNGRFASSHAWVGAVLAGGGNVPGVAIGSVGENQAAKLAELGFHAAGKKIALDSSCARHIDKRHGRGEWRKDQRAVTIADIAGAGRIFGGSTFARSRTGHPDRFEGVLKEKGERIETVWVARRHAVVLFDMWIKRG